MDKLLINRSSFLVVLYYAIFSILWIVFSDKVVLFFFSDPKILTTIQTFKGLLFVLVTSFLLYFLVYRYLKIGLKSSEELYIEKIKKEELNLQIELIVENSPDGIIFINKNAIIKLCNQKAKEILKIDTLLDVSIYDSLSNFVFFSELKYALNSKISSEYDGDIFNDNRYIKTSFRPYFNKTGEFLGVICSFIDVTAIAHLEVKLKNSLRYLENILDTIPAPIFVKNKNFYYTVCNEAFAKINGKTKSDFIGKSVYEIAPQELADIYHKADLEVIKDKYQVYEGKAKSSNNEIKDVIFYKSILLDSNGEFDGIVGTMLDITEKKILEDKLKESNRNLQYAQKLSNIGYWKFTYETSKFEYSKEAREIFGIDEAETSLFKFEDMLLFIDEKDREATKKMFLESLKAKQSIKLTSNIINKNDQKIVIEQIWQHEYIDGDDYAVSSFGVIQDITELYELLEKNRKLSVVVEQNPLAIVITDVDGVIEYVNKSFLSYSKYSFDELIGKNQSILQSGYTTEVVYQDLWKTISKGEIWRGTFKNVDKNNIEFWDSTVIYPVFDSNQNIINYIGIKENITQNVLLEQELEKKDKMMIYQSRQAAMGEMISMISHQWRQPLTSVSSIVNNLLLDIQFNDINKDTFNQKLSEINSQLKYMSNTIEDFRNFFNPNKNKQLINICETITKATIILDKTFKNEQIDVKISYNKCPSIYLNENELMQVLLNFFNNCRDVFKEREISSPKINIEVIDLDEYIGLVIEDNGGGIHSDLMEKIFEPYFTTKEQRHGTGLGLYITKMIVEKTLNGTIEIRNTTDGVMFLIKILKVEK